MTFRLDAQTIFKLTHYQISGCPSDDQMPQIPHVRVQAQFNRQGGLLLSSSVLVPHHPFDLALTLAVAVQTLQIDSKENQ